MVCALCCPDGYIESLCQISEDTFPETFVKFLEIMEARNLQKMYVWRSVGMKFELDLDYVSLVCILRFCFRPKNSHSNVSGE